MLAHVEEKHLLQCDIMWPSPYYARTYPAAIQKVWLIYVYVNELQCTCKCMCIRFSRYVAIAVDAYNY